MPAAQVPANPGLALAPPHFNQAAKLDIESTGGGAGLTATAVPYLCCSSSEPLKHLLKYSLMPNAIYEGERIACNFHREA